MSNVIRVTFPDGTVSCYRSPLYTIIDVLKRIGVDNFPKIDFKTGQHRIVTQTVADNLKKYSIEIVPGWFFINRSDTREKNNMLINLNRQFNLNIKIERGRFKPKSNPPGKKSIRPKYKIIVTMSDGTVIDYESYKDVFIECLYKLNPRRISASANLQINRNQDLFSTTNPDGNRLNVDDNLYVLYPKTARDAYFYLNIIKKRLNIDLQVDLLPCKID